MKTRKQYTSVIRMGAAYNDLFSILSPEFGDFDLPPPPEPYRGKGDPSFNYLKARDRKLSRLAQIGRDLCAAYGIERKANSKRRINVDARALVPAEVPEVRYAA